MLGRNIRIPARIPKFSGQLRSHSNVVFDLRRIVAKITEEIEELEDAPNEYITETPTPKDEPGRENSQIDKGMGLGRCKSAMVRIRLVPGEGNWTTNGHTLEGYFPNKLHQQLVMTSLVLLDLRDHFDVLARIDGGGTSGQVGALCLGISWALNEIDRDTNRPALKKAGFLTCDAREVGCKKVGLKKACKAPQYSKR